MKYTCILLVALCGHISLNYVQVNTPIQNTVVINENKQPMLLGYCTIGKPKEVQFVL